MRHELNTIGERIRFIRKKLELTQQEFANLLECHGYKTNFTTLSDYENDKADPNTKLVKIICKIGNVNPNWLFGYQQEKFEDIARVVELADTPDSKHFVERRIYPFADRRHFRIKHKIFN